MTNSRFKSLAEATARVTAGLITLPECLPKTKIIRATVPPNTSAVSDRAMIPEKDTSESKITAPGPARTSTYVPTSSERHSFLQLEQGKLSKILMPHLD